VLYSNHQEKLSQDSQAYTGKNMQQQGSITQKLNGGQGLRLCYFISLLACPGVLTVLSGGPGK
jgi:hypothetical protein